MATRAVDGHSAKSRVCHDVEDHDGAAAAANTTGFGELKRELECGRLDVRGVEGSEGGSRHARAEVGSQLRLEFDAGQDPCAIIGERVASPP